MAAASAKGNYGDGDVVAHSRVPFVGLVYYAHKMRELHGVTSFMDLSLKHQLLLFDKLYVCGASSYISRFPEVPHAVNLAFLDSRGILKHAPPNSWEDGIHNVLSIARARKVSPTPMLYRTIGFSTRALASEIDDNDADIVPATEFEMPAFSDDHPSSKAVPSARPIEILDLAVDAFPKPNDSTPLQDILDFRDSMAEKRWAFRRFISALSTKEQSASAIQDEIEWMVNEYAKAMHVHHIKASQSFVDVFVISPLEIIENLVKFNWSKIAKGALQVQKRKVELLEAEMKAPGRECAYVFDARKRFGPKS